MYISRSLIASALLGLGAATTHLGEMGMEMTSAVAASETAAAAPAESTGMAEEGTVPTHVISVGGSNGSLTFTPDNVEAAVGDLVQFQFYPKNHSVVQSTFDRPCVPIQNVMPNMTNAFFSGFMPSTAAMGSTTGLLTYTIRVMDTKPVWFYCSQGMHCQSGMVGAINAATSGEKTVAAFKAKAAEASENLSPGQGAGQGNAGPAPSGTEGAGGAGGEGTAATGTAGSDPAEQTTNAAPGLYDSRQSLLGLTLGGLAAWLVL